MLRCLRLLLFPIGWLYHLTVQLRRFCIKSYRASIPVICIGNITVGGTGKTPVVLWLARYLKIQGKKVHILSRGYKGRLSYVQVDIQKHSAVDVGDEPLMLARSGFSVWVGVDRAKLAKMAEQAGADVLLMDDGFQNATLRKDFSILVFDGERGLGNGLCLPAGNLREYLSTAERYADAAFIIGEDKTGLINKLSLPVFSGNIEPVSLEVDHKRYVAFAGIGRPSKFFKTLRVMKSNVVKTFSYPDHYAYTIDDLKRMEKFAKNNKAELITTEKDWVKFSKSWQRKINYLAINLKIMPEKKFLKLLQKII